MGRTGITYIDVCNAIASIQGMQKNPTVDSIREELSTGSRSTIAKYFQEWKTKNGAKNTTERGVPIELQNLIQNLWEKIQSDADNKIEKHQVEVEGEMNSVKNQLAQTQHQNALLHDEINLLTEKLNTQINAANALTIKLHQSDKEKTKSDERIASLETQNSNHKAENERLHQLLKNTQDNLTHYQNAIEKQRQEQQLRSEKEKQDFELKITLLLNQKNQLIEEKTKALECIDYLTKDNQIQSEKLATIEKLYQEMQTQYHQLIAHKNQLDQAMQSKEKSISALSESLKEKTEKNIDLNIELAVLKKDLSKMNEENRNLNEKLHQLESDLKIQAQENR